LTKIKKAGRGGGGGGGQFGNFYINFAQPLVVKILKEGMKEVGEKYDVNVN